MATDEQHIQTLETMLDEMKADLASTDEADFTRPQTATLMLQLIGQIAQLRVEQRKVDALEGIASALSAGWDIEPRDGGFRVRGR